MQGDLYARHHFFPRIISSPWPNTEDVRLQIVFEKGEVSNKLNWVCSNSCNGLERIKQTQMELALAIYQNTVFTLGFKSQPCHIVIGILMYKYPSKTNHFFYISGTSTLIDQFFNHASVNCLVPVCRGQRNVRSS